MKWLLTCFEPFAGGRSNSSELVWRELKRRGVEGVGFAGPLPVSFGRVWSAFENEAAGCDAVLALGQSESRGRISLECLALNRIDAGIPDNDGARPDVAPVLLEGPDVLWSPIPWIRLGESLHWSRSYSAGTFVCNYFMYRLLNWASVNGRMAGFVHIPVLGSQAETAFERVPRMADATAVEALENILRFLVALGPDRR